MQTFFLKNIHIFSKTSLCYENLPKKISSNFESRARVKLNFENRKFSYFSMEVRILKIHNSKTIKDRKNLILTSNWVFTSSFMLWYQNLENPKFLKQYIVVDTSIEFFWQFISFNASLYTKILFKKELFPKHCFWTEIYFSIKNIK